MKLPRAPTGSRRLMNAALILLCLAAFGLEGSRLESSHLEKSGRVPSGQPRIPRHHARKSYTGVWTRP